MESDPYVLIEGMIIAGVVIGATQGYIYVRSEYPHAIATLEAAIADARDAGWLGDSVLGCVAALRARSRARAPARTSAARKPRCSNQPRRQARHRARQAAGAGAGRACSASRP